MAIPSTEFQVVAGLLSGSACLGITLVVARYWGPLLGHNHKITEEPQCERPCATSHGSNPQTPKR